MTFALPSWPGYVTAKPFLSSKNVAPEPILGGEQQRFTRLGSRFGCTFTLPPMEHADARLWVGALIRADREKATIEWPQGGMGQPAAGNVTISTESSANATVIGLAGLPAGYAVLSGQFFNHVKDGSRYLYACVQTGTSPLIIGPPLRKPANVGDVIDFDTVLIEGWVDGPDTPWDVDNAHLYGITFTIREAK